MIDSNATTTISAFLFAIACINIYVMYRGTRLIESGEKGAGYFLFVTSGILAVGAILAIIVLSA